MKLKIALNLKAEDVIDILSVAGFKLGKHELSAFFRKPGHKHFRECKDQVLRNFLQGMQEKYRKDPSVSPAKTATEKEQTKKEFAKKVSSKKESENAPAPVAYQWKKKPNTD